MYNTEETGRAGHKDVRRSRPEKTIEDRRDRDREDKIEDRSDRDRQKDQRGGKAIKVSRRRAIPLEVKGSEQPGASQIKQNCTRALVASTVSRGAIKIRFQPPPRSLAVVVDGVLMSVVVGWWWW